MKKSLLLTRKECPIKIVTHYPEFLVPVHPSILNLPQDVRFDVKICYEVLKPAEEWFWEDIEKWIGSIKNKEEREHQTKLYLSKKTQLFRIPSFSGRPEGAEIIMGIDLLAGESVYAETELRYLHRSLLVMSDEKLKEYFVEPREGYAFYQHNINTFQKNFLTRDWAIQYVNYLIG